MWVGLPLVMWSNLFCPDAIFAEVELAVNTKEQPVWKNVLECKRSEAERSGFRSVFCLNTKAMDDVLSPRRRQHACGQQCGTHNGMISSNNYSDAAQCEHLRLDLHSTRLLVDSQCSCFNTGVEVILVLRAPWVWILWQFLQFVSPVEDQKFKTLAKMHS